MLTIGGQPILWHIMKSYASHGITDFVLCLGYKGWVIKEYFLNYRAMRSDITVKTGSEASITYHHSDEDDWTITLAETGLDTMTGGRLAAVRKYLDDGPFCLTYGDGVADVDLTALAAHHKKRGKVATLTSVRVVGRFGELDIEGGLIRQFQEKPDRDTARINGGFMMFDGSRIWDFVEDRPDLILERQPLERLAAAGELSAFEHDGYWQCMDTMREYEELNSLWQRGEARWKNW